MHLASFGKLDAVPQDLPGRIVGPHDLIARVDVQIAQVNTVRIVLTAILKDKFPQ